MVHVKWTQHLTGATIFDSDSDKDNISEPETQADVNENIPESAANTESQTGHPKKKHLPTPLPMAILQFGTCTCELASYHSSL